MQTVTTVIVGAGQAGLAMSRELTVRDVDHVILERGAVGHAWRTQRWDSLRLLTPNWANVLPGAPYQGLEPDGFMRVGELAAHLDEYAARIAAPVLCQTAVRRISGGARSYRVETNGETLGCETVILATGACARVKVPSLSKGAPLAVFQTTGAAYKRPSDLPDGGVLVVGGSATGVQLARELQLSGRPVTLAVGNHLRLPRAYRGYDIERWLEITGVLDERFDQIEDLERARRTISPQLIGGSEPVDLNALGNIGVEIVGRLADIRDGRALFSGGLGAFCASADLKMRRLLDGIDAWATQQGLDGELPLPVRPAPTRLPMAPRLELDLTNGGVRSIVWATGYRPDFSWLDLPVFDHRGRLRHHGGVVDVPGVYAIGLPVLRRRRSHQISGVGADAADLAAHLKHHLNARRAA